jgi:hypothetical protein
MPLDTKGHFLYSIPTMKRWKRVFNNSLPDLRVLEINGIERGFVYKPHDTKTERNAWRIYKGIGTSNVFVGHQWTLEQSKSCLEETFNK